MYPAAVGFQDCRRGRAARHFPAVHHQPQGKGQQQAFWRKFRLNARTKPDEHRRFGIAEYT